MSCVTGLPKVIQGHFHCFGIIFPGLCHFTAQAQIFQCQVQPESARKVSRGNPRSANVHLEALGPGVVEQLQQEFRFDPGFLPNATAFGHDRQIGHADEVADQLHRAGRFHFSHIVNGRADDFEYRFKLLVYFLIAANGFDVFSHACESFTARPFTQRPAPKDTTERPLSQGANPYSDIVFIQAIKLIGQNLVQAIAAPQDDNFEALMFAGLLAGIGFGLKGMGYTVEDLEDLTEGAIPQRRLIDNAPPPISREQLKELFKKALAYW